jgi:uncharacterized Zn finger protein
MIRAVATPESFQRGKSYFEQGAISNAAIQGNVLSGDCEGTQSPFYYVRVELDAAGIRSADCTCPYKFSGYCKHIVALLFAYLHAPKEFATRESPAELLSDLSRDDLLALLTNLIERQPDLYDWVHAAITVPSTDKSKRTRHKKVDTKVYRRQVRNILHSLDLNFRVLTCLTFRLAAPILCTIVAILFSRNDGYETLSSLWHDPARGASRR